LFCSSEPFIVSKSYEKTIGERTLGRGETTYVGAKRSSLGPIDFEIIRRGQIDHNSIWAENSQ